MTHIPRLLLGLDPDALDQVEEKFAGHGLDGGGQRLIVDVLGEEADGQRQVVQGQRLAHVVNQVSQGAVRQGPATHPYP